MSHRSEQGRLHLEALQSMVGAAHKEQQDMETLHARKLQDMETLHARKMELAKLQATRAGLVVTKI